MIIVENICTYFDTKKRKHLNMDTIQLRDTHRDDGTHPSVYYVIKRKGCICSDSIYIATSVVHVL